MPLMSQLPNEVRRDVVNLFDAAKIIDFKADTRSQLGVMMQAESVRPWERSVTFATVLRILSTWSGVWDRAAEEHFRRLQALTARIQALGLPAVIDKAPPLNVSSVRAVWAETRWAKTFWPCSTSSRRP